MGPTWVLPSPDRPYVGPMNLAIRELLHFIIRFLDLPVDRHHFKFKSNTFCQINQFLVIRNNSVSFPFKTGNNTDWHVWIHVNLELWVQIKTSMLKLASIFQMLYAHVKLYWLPLKKAQGLSQVKHRQRLPKILRRKLSYHDLLINLYVPIFVGKTTFVVICWWVQFMWYIKVHYMNIWRKINTQRFYTPPILLISSGYFSNIHYPFSIAQTAGRERSCVLS